MTTYSLSELTTFIRRVFALNLPEAVWVSGEFAQVNDNRGHHWLTLVEKDADTDEVIAKLEGVVWKSQMASIQREHGLKLVRSLFVTGMAVRLRVTTSFHQRYGLRLVVEDIDPDFTVGALERRRQRTLEALATERLLDKNRALVLPELPQRLAIISSETAAGLADFREQLQGNTYGYDFKIEVFTATVQGAQAAEDVARRLRQIGRRKRDYDAVVLVRGGGGRTDLAAFDEEAVARAIAACPLPVLTGIGHEIDSSIADRVAHTTLKTPTAAAVFLVDRLLQAEHRLVQLGRSIVAASGVQDERLRLARIERELSVLPTNVLNATRRELESRAQLLAALRPDTTLARGYALVSQEGKLITAAEQLREGDLTIRLAKGRRSGKFMPPSA